MKKSFFTLLTCLVFSCALSNVLNASGPKNEQESLPDESAITYSPQTYETIYIVDEEGFIVDTIPLSLDSAVPYDIIDFYLESGYDVFID